MKNALSVLGTVAAIAVILWINLNDLRSCVGGKGNNRSVPAEWQGSYISETDDKMVIGASSRTYNGKEEPFHSVETPEDENMKGLGLTSGGFVKSTFILVYDKKSRKYTDASGKKWRKVR